MNIPPEILTDLGQRRWLYSDTNNRIKELPVVILGWIGHGTLVHAAAAADYSHTYDEKISGIRVQVNQCRITKGDPLTVDALRLTPTVEETRPEL